MKNKTIYTISIIFFIIALVGMVFVIKRSGEDEKKKVKIGFVMNGSKDELGWNNMHYEGIKNACDLLDVELILKENVTDNTGMCSKAIEELVEEDAKMIILSSYDYCAESIDTIRKYKDVQFYVSSYEYEEDNIKSYFTRYYQARYLSGIIAGSMSKTGKIGYVAAYDIDEVNRGISAFALGVSHANEDAEVIVYYTNTWDNSASEIKAVDELIANENIDVVTCHQNQDNVVREADKKGIYSIGYHQVPSDMSDKYLTTVLCDWEMTYKEIVSQFLSGKVESKIAWLGIDKNVVKLEGYSPLISDEAREEVNQAIVKLEAGQDVFSGLIYDNEGNIRCNQDESISDNILLKDFKWLVKGVRVYEK